MFPRKKKKKKRPFICPQVKSIKKGRICILNDTADHQLQYTWSYPSEIFCCVRKCTPLFKPSELVPSQTMKTSLVVISSNTESNFLCAVSADAPLSTRSYRSAVLTLGLTLEPPGELLKLPRPRPQLRTGISR